MRVFVFVLALATASSTSAFAADVDVALQFHLFGEWAADCASAPSPTNPHETYGLDGDGTVTRTLAMSVANLDGKTVLHKLKAVAPDLLQSEWTRLADDKVQTVIQRIEGDVSHGWASIDSAGTVFVSEGRYASSQEPTIVFHRCGTQ